MAMFTEEEFARLWVESTEKYKKARSEIKEEADSIIEDDPILDDETDEEKDQAGDLSDGSLSDDELDDLSDEFLEEDEVLNEDDLDEANLLKMAADAAKSAVTCTGIGQAMVDVKDTVAGVASGIKDGAQKVGNALTFKKSKLKIKK